MLTFEDIHNHVAEATIAMAVLDTSTMAIKTANPAFADLLGRSMHDTIGLRPHAYLDAERLAASINVVDTMRRGWMDMCEGYCEFIRGDGTSAWSYSWSMPIGSGPPYESLLMCGAAAPSDKPAEFDARWANPGRVILGALDHDWRFSDIARAAEALLWWPPGESGRAKLHELVHPGDVPVLLASLGRASFGPDATTIHVRVKTADGAWTAAGVTVSPLCTHATPRFGIMIQLNAAADEKPDVERVVRLEEQLLQLASAVRAGAMTAPGVAYVDTSGLSERQAEIVRRLAQGQRGPDIARDLFLSASTVRNHLSAIYRKLGVKSQFELIQRLRPENHQP